MEFARLLNAKHFDPQRGKFTSLAFKNSTGVGVSVICLGCVAASGVPICDHIRIYYPERVTGSPPIFWRFAGESMPVGWRAEQQTSPSGDVCHHNIHGLSDRELRKVIGTRTMSDFSTCAPEGLRTADISDVCLERKSGE